ncbi:hypothetical protein FB45DRAFT_887795 [Roridomyces roridus]|uniref:Mid2 domain-containing protein n=1 Tax=Roridomyces roridus TaxID=1738132 RepID=A0AAD7CJA0_9AGAR|nr:hypothetical protein FB45DRAFT_887795 [Roridomyces roridus]
MPLVALAVFLFCFLGGKAHADPVNLTIDDTNSTHWNFQGNWHAVTPAAPCTNCFTRPDPNSVFNSTWHDGSILSNPILLTGTFSFQGSAVYIYGIDVTDPGNVSFAMSNPTMEGFHYYAGSGYTYNSLFFSATDLDASVSHTVTFTITISSAGGGSALFDYAHVTVEQSDSTSGSSSSTSASSTLAVSSSSSTSSISYVVSFLLATCCTLSASSSVQPSTAHKSHTGALIGGVVGGVGGLALVSVLLLLIFRWRRSLVSRDGTHEPQDGSEAMKPFLSPVNVPLLSRPDSGSPPMSGMRWDMHRNLEVEERLRNLERLTATASDPPAYNSDYTTVSIPYDLSAGGIDSLASRRPLGRHTKVQTTTAR